MGLANGQLVTDIRKRMSKNNTCVSTLTHNKGFVVYTKQQNVFCSMISDQRTEYRQKSFLCLRHSSHATTWNCFETHSQDHRGGSSRGNRGNCPGILPCLCQQWHTSAPACPPLSLLLLHLKHWQRATETKQFCVTLHSQTAYSPNALAFTVFTVLCSP